MTILQRYIVKTILKASALVIFIILGLAFLIDLLAELKDIGSGDYNFFKAINHVLFKLPYDLYQFFPMIVLLGGVAGLSTLSSQHELIVMRASGMSIKKIFWSVIIAAFLLIFFGSLIGEGLAPRALYLANIHKNNAQSGGQAVATATGVWIHEANNFLHINKIIGHNHLQDVKRYEFDANHRLLAAYSVKSLDFRGGRWFWQDMQKTIFGQNRTQSLFIKEGIWDLKIKPNLLNVGMTKPQELSLPRLAENAAHLIKNNLQATRFQFEFWKRIFQPLTTLVMTLLAIPFVFVAPRSSNLSLRLVFGVIVGFTFYILNAFFGQFSIVFQISPWVASLFPTVLFAFLGYFASLKIIRR